MIVGSHFETTGAKGAQVHWYAPGEEIGADVVEPGQYAIGIDLPDGGAFWVGTIPELNSWVDRVVDAVNAATDHSQKPLTIRDFAPDEDGNYQCPRCTDTQLYEPQQYADLFALVKDIEHHIKAAHPHSGQS
jgi:hypothetical protein